MPISKIITGVITLGQRSFHTCPIRKLDKLETVFSAGCSGIPKFKVENFHSQKLIDKFMGFIKVIDKQSEQIIKTFPFEHYGKNGIPLKYPRENFIQDIAKVLINVPKENRAALLENSI